MEIEQRAPSKRARKAPAAKSAQPTESTEPARGQIEFRGRTMRVVMPAPEQILVWRRIHVRLEQANIDKWNGQEVLDALDKVRTIIDTVLVDQADIGWLDDEMLAGRLTIREASAILVDAVKSFQNRSQRRAAKTAGPARRRKAST
jgi:hypothetical protein